MTTETQKSNYASALALIAKAENESELHRVEQIITNVYDATNDLTAQQFARLCDKICDRLERFWAQQSAA